jgi:TonB family protein
MKRIILFLGVIFSLVTTAHTQEAGDTTIYTALEEMPRFPSPACEELDTTAAAKNNCAQQVLLSFVYNNLTYPLEARQNGNEGTVVASFVVEKDGRITNPTILKEVGGGTGLEVLRLINEMIKADFKWIPGKNKGQPVRAKFTLPVKFRLEEALPYVLVGQDTVYSEFEKPLEFQGGTAALMAHLEEHLVYPDNWKDSCRIGRIELQLLIRKDGDVRILDMIDYNDLGFDFWYAAIDAGTSTLGKWDMATYEGRQVTAAYEVNLPFKPEEAGCRTVIDNYEAANALAEEGAQLFNGGEKDAGIEKLSQAIELLPNDANIRIMRGQAHLDLNQFDQACEDLRIARNIALIDWYDGVLPIICK